jgi:FtsH-binding integral membrane protein
MNTIPPAIIIGAFLSIISLVAGMIILRYMLKRGYPKLRIFLTSFIPGIFLAIGMNFILSSSADPELTVPLYMHAGCTVVWILFWIFWELYRIFTYDLYPKKSPILEMIKRKSRDRKEQ